MATRGGGSVLNISSIAAYMNATPYGVSKLAVRGLTIAFATEFAGSNIRVNGIAPGSWPPRTRWTTSPRDLSTSSSTVTSSSTDCGQMGDIVNAMLYLCSDDSSFITGETLRVSGGFPLHI